MGMTKNEILDLASRYISADEIVDFPFENELFCFLSRELPENKVLGDEEGWGFGGYSVCIGYTADEESKPRGKWIWMHFASLDSFPPRPQTLKLQPPHIVKGTFQNPERTHEIRFLKINVSGATASFSAEKNKEKTPDTTPVDTSKIVKFRPKKSK